VTFRIYAPKASEVSIEGDWITQGRGTGGPLQKDDQGIWSITVGPLVPDFYTYTYTVDGVRTIDPQNPTIKQGISRLENMFLVPGAEAAFAATRSVPHGDVRIVWYDSPALGCVRRMHVYMPPGYDGSDEPYPVLYLIHCGGDDDSAWSTIGRAGFIADNLLAAGKVEPMIVVMPNGSVRRPGFSYRLAGADRTNELLKLFWIAAGEDDRTITDGGRRLSEMLTRRGIRHEFHETAGGHTWINWRRYLYDFSQLLFRP
jgi:enterochelin esterase-like enzyme